MPWDDLLARYGIEAYGVGCWCWGRLRRSPAVAAALWRMLPTRPAEGVVPAAHPVPKGARAMAMTRATRRSPVRRISASTWGPAAARRGSAMGRFAYAVRNRGIRRWMLVLGASAAVAGCGGGTLEDGVNAQGGAGGAAATAN